ncbi:thioesterase family protein [Pseudokineococcus basanitobsidens]|uniref:Thioesterase family protein n=1 Tax=Pseudokineococcus basanitobsidens TaxID=1926649 RepID=A0ABU8RJG9_9ACTN
MPAREVPVPLRWSDMDAYGHVNNVQHLRLLEEARISAFRTWSGEATSDSPVRSGTIVARNEVEYLVPLKFQHEPVTVRLWISRHSGASFDLGYEVRGRAQDAPDDGLRADAEGWVVYARAESTVVLVDLDTGRPRRLTPAESEMFAALDGPPVELRRRARERAARG